MNTAISTSNFIFVNVFYLLIINGCTHLPVSNLIKLIVNELCTSVVTQVIASLSNIHRVKLKTHPLLFRVDDLNKM